MQLESAGLTGLQQNRQQNGSWCVKLVITQSSISVWSGLATYWRKSKLSIASPDLNLVYVVPKLIIIWLINGKFSGLLHDCSMSIRSSASYPTLGYPVITPRECFFIQSYHDFLDP